MESLCPFFPKGGWKVSLFTAVQAQSIKSDMPKTREEKRAVNTLGMEWDTGCHSNSTVPWKKMRVWSNLRPPRKPTGEGNGNPLQYFCLENPMDRGAWRATAHGVAKSQTCLSRHASVGTVVKLSGEQEGLRGSVVSLPAASSFL